MGSEYFWFLDIAVIALVAAAVYRGAKKGAVAVLIGSVSVIVAFIAAFALCGAVSDTIYDKFVRDRVEEQIHDRLGSAVDTEMIAGLSQADMMKTKLKSGTLAELEIVYDDKNSAVVDLSGADMTDTGIQNADLTGFGIKKDFDWSLVKIGNISVTRSEVEKYGIGNIILARVIAANLTSGDVFNALTEVGDKLGETASPSLRGLGDDLADGSKDAIYTFVVSIITVADGTIGERVMNDIVTPTVMVPLRAIVFCVIFAAVTAILNLIAYVSKIINKVPIVASVNSVSGAVLGALKAVLSLVMICIIMRMLIALSGDSLVFINNTTIEKTFIFRHIYAFDPLSFFGG